MDFSQYPNIEGFIENPYAGQMPNGDWLRGAINIDFLQEHFRGCTTLSECVEATESEGLKLFFEYLKTQL